MSLSRLELFALALFVGSLGLAVGETPVRGGVSDSVTNNGQQVELKLSALRVHQQLLQAEIGRLYVSSFGPETPLLLEELQHRQQEVQLQIETLQGGNGKSPTQLEQDAQHLALNLSADFEYLQQKLDELKQQLQQLDALQQGNNSSSSSGKQAEATPTTTPTATGSGTAATAGSSSYFWTPLLAMPEFPSGSISQQQTAQSSGGPSLIKRLLAMLRPTSAVSGSASTSGSNLLRSNKVQLLSAEELLPQLQLQRQFLDDAIKRLELLAANKNDSKH